MVDGNPSKCFQRTKSVEMRIKTILSILANNKFQKGVFLSIIGLSIVMAVFEF